MSYILKVSFDGKRWWWIYKPKYVSTRRSEAFRFVTREAAEKEATNYKHTEIVELEVSDIPFNQQGLNI